MLILKGKTNKGKNRIKVHGTEWCVVEVRQSVSCVNGPGMLIRSLSTNDKRWIAQENDIDFAIIAAK